MGLTDRHAFLIDVKNESLIVSRLSFFDKVSKMLRNFFATSCKVYTKMLTV